MPRASGGIAGIASRQCDGQRHGGAAWQGSWAFCMKNFARALKEAWRHWPALAAALLLLAGRGGPVGRQHCRAVPDHRDDAQRPVAAGVEPAAAGHGAGAARRPTGRNPPARTANRRRCRRRRAPAAAVAARHAARRACEVDRASVEWSQRLQPFFDRFLPTKPFHTVVFIVTLVAIATALKQL